MIVHIFAALTLSQADKETHGKVETLCLSQGTEHLLSICQNGQDIPSQFQQILCPTPDHVRVEKTTRIEIRRSSKGQ